MRCHIASQKEHVGDFFASAAAVNKFLHAFEKCTNLSEIVVFDISADLGGKPLLFGASSHYLFSAMTRTTLSAAYLKSRENTFKKPLMEKAASWRDLFQKEKHIPVVYLQASSYQGLHLSPCCFSRLQSDLKCSVNGKELRAISGCSHSQTSAHPNSIPGVRYTSQLHSNTQGQQGRTGKLFLRHLHLVLIVREPFGCMGGIHTFALGKKAAWASC